MNDMIRVAFTICRECFPYQLPVIAIASTDIIGGYTSDINAIQLMEIQMEGFKKSQENLKVI